MAIYSHIYYNYVPEEVALEIIQFHFVSEFPNLLQERWIKVSH